MTLRTPHGIASLVLELSNVRLECTTSWTEETLVCHLQGSAPNKKLPLRSHSLRVLNTARNVYFREQSRKLIIIIYAPCDDHYRIIKFAHYKLMHNNYMIKDVLYRVHIITKKEKKILVTIRYNNLKLSLPITECSSISPVLQLRRFL